MDGRINPSTEHADVSFGTTSQLATVMQTDGVSVLGDRLQLLSSLVSLYRVTCAYDLLQSSTLLSVTSNHLRALNLASFH